MFQVGNFEKSSSQTQPALPLAAAERNVGFYCSPAPCCSQKYLFSSGVFVRLASKNQFFGPFPHSVTDFKNGMGEELID